MKLPKIYIDNMMLFEWDRVLGLWADRRNQEEKYPVIKVGLWKWGWVITFRSRL